MDYLRLEKGYFWIILFHIYQKQLKIHLNLIKTGFTNAAGDCLVASATRNGQTLAVVLFNDDDRWEDAPAILDYGFRRLQIGK